MTRSMLYLLGGAARSGKSILAQQLLASHRVPYFPLDILKMGLANSSFVIGIKPDDPSIALGERLWPLLRGMSVNILETGVTYLLEGDILLPKYVAELKQQYRDMIRACFLGYTDVSIADKILDIRRFGGGPNDWLQKRTNAEVQTLIVEMVDFSHYLQKECSSYRLPFVNTSRDFQTALDAAFQSLTAL